MCVAECGLDGGEDGGDVVLASELGDEAAAWFQRLRYGFRGFFRRHYPVEYGVGENGVKRFIRSVGSNVGRFEADIRIVVTRGFDHRMGIVDSEHLRAGFRDPGRELAGAAAYIENPL